MIFDMKYTHQFKSFYISCRIFENIKISTKLQNQKKICWHCIQNNNESFDHAIISTNSNGKVIQVAYPLPILKQQCSLVPFFPPPTQWGSGQHISLAFPLPVAEQLAEGSQFPSSYEARRCSTEWGQSRVPTQQSPTKTYVRASSFWALAFQKWATGHPKNHKLSTQCLRVVYHNTNNFSDPLNTVFKLLTKDRSVNRYNMVSVRCNQPYYSKSQSKIKFIMLQYGMQK